MLISAGEKRQEAQDESMKNKILFFDIDGTIYREDHGVPGSTEAALIKCAEQGHLLMLSTGRGLSSIPDAVLRLPFSGGVFGCGTYVQAGGRVLLDAAVMGSQCQEIIETLYRNRCPFFVNNSDYIYYDPGCIPAGFEDIIRRMKHAYHGRLRPLSELPGRISKLTAYPQDFSLVPQICRELSPWFDCIVHPEYAYIEPVLKGYTKGTGVSLILQELGIPREASYGFGDSSNDVPMLEAVGCGVIMGEAPEQIKGGFIRAGSIYEDGISRILTELRLI